jgi:hypothetical protein
MRRDIFMSGSDCYDEGRKGKRTWGFSKFFRALLSKNDQPAKARGGQPYPHFASFYCVTLLPISQGVEKSKPTRERPGLEGWGRIQTTCPLR